MYHHSIIISVCVFFVLAATSTNHGFRRRYVPTDSLVPDTDDPKIYPSAIACAAYFVAKKLGLAGIDTQRFYFQYNDTTSECGLGSIDIDLVPAGDFLEEDGTHVMGQFHLLGNIEKHPYQSVSFFRL